MERAALLTGAMLTLALAAASADGAGQVTVPKYIADAVADSARPAEDTQRDKDRKPAECLAFAGVRPGDTVADLLPGSGYFTRLFSGIVGPAGKVYAVAPVRPANAPADAPDRAAAARAIAADPHYRNVTVTPLRAQENYHDLHNIPDLKVVDFDKAVLKALKPGGVFIVLDHAAEAGSGFRDTSTLHRIDEEAVKKEVLAAGFKFEGESRVLRNKDDPHTAKVFDPSMRGHTDQFILKFRRPK
jgi:predicted methyltransferase